MTTALTWDILYGDGVVISTDQNGKTTSYTYGLERISAKTGSTRTEYVYDGRSSVAAEVSYNNAWYTFGGGLARKNVVSKSYSPFGELLTEQTSGFGYNGEYYNAATGMIYLRARFYEPEMNRFGQKDLLRGRITDPLSLNRYPYCTNDPIDFCDPSGMAIVRNTMVQMTDGGGSGNSSQKKTSIIEQVIAKASIAVSSAAVIAKNTIRNILNSNGSEELTPIIRGQSLTSVSPGVRNVAVSLQSCFDPNVVIRDGNIITYMGKRYAIPSGSPIVNWTPDAVRRYIIPNQTPLPPTQQIANQATISKSDRVADGGLNIFGGVLFTWLGAAAIDTALGVACPPAALALAFVLGGGSVLYGGSMAAEGFNDIQLAYEGDTASIAFNPVRDTFFGGDQGLYDLFGSLSGMGSMGIVYSYPDLYGESTYSSYSQNAAIEVERYNDLPQNQGYQTFDALKQAVGSAGEGRHWHHIVEQSQIERSGFAPEMIHNTSNVISVDAATHAKITGYYNSKLEFTNGLTVRDWLAGQSYDFQYEFGLNVLRAFGVIR